MQKLRLTRKAVFVCITRANRGEIPDIDNGTTLEDRSCGYWHVNVPKANKCELLIAVDGGTIVKVWEIDRDFGWRPMEEGALPTQHTEDVDPSRKYCCLLRVTPENAQLEGRRIIDIEGVPRLYGPIGYNF